MSYAIWLKVLLEVAPEPIGIFDFWNIRVFVNFDMTQKTKEKREYVVLALPCFEFPSHVHKT